MLRTNLQAETAEDLWAKYMPPTIPSKRVAREGPRYGGVLGLRHVGHPEAPAPATSAIHPKPSASGVDNAQPFFSDEGPLLAVMQWSDNPASLVGSISQDDGE